jgi:hypothetical protein
MIHYPLHVQVFVYTGTRTCPFQFSILKYDPLSVETHVQIFVYTYLSLELKLNLYQKLYPLNGCTDFRVRVLVQRFSCTSTPTLQNVPAMAVPQRLPPDIHNASLVNTITTSHMVRIVRAFLEQRHAHMSAPWTED